MSGDDVRRVELLIRLATDASAADNEARNAALVACRSIRRLGLALVASGELAALRSQLAEAAAELRAAEQRAAAAARAAPAAEPRAAPSPAPKRRASGAVRTIVNGYPDKTCIDCGAEIVVGDPCQWVVGIGLRCLECGT